MFEGYLSTTIAAEYLYNWSVHLNSKCAWFWLDFAAVYDITQSESDCSVWRLFLFSCDPLMLSQTSYVTTEAPLGISLTLLHTAAAAFMNNK